MSYINPFIFREYDIRGKVAEDFPEHVVVKLGKAFGSYVRRSGGREIGVSGDIRLSTPKLINTIYNILIRASHIFHVLGSDLINFWTFCTISCCSTH